MKQFYLNTSRIQLNQSLNANSNISIHKNFIKNRKSKQNSKKYYKVLEDENTSLGKLSKMSEMQIQKFIKSLNARNQYMYLDITQDSGVKVMQKCEQQEDQCQQLGNNYIADLHNLSQMNNKSVNYLLEQKQISRMKQDLQGLMKNQLQKSKQKVKKRTRFFPNHFSQRIDNSKLRIYRKMDMNLVQKYKSLQEYQMINQQISDRQSKLLEHYQRIESKYPINTNLSIKSLKEFSINNLLPSLSNKINTIQL